MYHRGIIHNLRQILLIQTGGCSLCRMLDVIHVRVQVFLKGGAGTFLLFSSWLLLVA